MRCTAFIRPFAAGLACLFLAGSAFAAHPIYRAELDGPALRGYDTVAYFTEGRAMLGSAGVVG